MWLKHLNFLASSSGKCKFKVQLPAPNIAPPPPQAAPLRPPSPRSSQSPSSSTRSRTNPSNGYPPNSDKNTSQSSPQITSPSSTVTESEEFTVDVKPPSPVIPKVLITEPDTSSVSKSSLTGKSLIYALHVTPFFNDFWKDKFKKRPWSIVIHYFQPSKGQILSMVTFHLTDIYFPCQLQTTFDNK